MFSEENIERTKERLVEYVKDNADDFEWKNVYSEGEYSGYWECKFKQLSDQPINNAMQVFGIDSTMDIIVETLEDFYEDFYNDYDEDDYGYDGDYNGFYDDDDEDEDEYKVFINGNSPLSLYEWITSDDVKSDKQTMGYIAKANVESENEDEPEIVRSSTTYSFSMPSGKEVSDKDMVNHPPHYNQGKFETIDIIEDIVRGYDDPVEAYLVGTTIKYLARAPFKGAKKQDLEKAVFYLKRAIDKQQ